MRHLNVLLLAAALVAVQGCAGTSSKTSSKVGVNSAGIYSAGMQDIDDSIEAKSSARIQEKYKGSQITVTSYNRRVLVIGEAPTASDKADIEHIIRAVPNVQEITNEISVGALSSATSQRIDARITREIRYDLGRNKSIQAGVIKIATIKGVVYLMGLVTHAEANAASEVASTTAGVQKVIRSFSYID
jgi:osmotically-inducible protein OsmY